MQPAPQGYGYPPPQPPPPKKTSPALIILIILAGFVALGGIGCVTCVLLASQAPRDVASKARAKSAPASAPEEDPIPVQAAQLIADYKANEIRADDKWKGKLVRVTGTVEDVKRDIMDAPYVTLTSGARFEFPHVRCALMKGQEAMASQLSKGSVVTYEARVDGLFGSVNLKECRFITRR